MFWEYHLVMKLKSHKHLIVLVAAAAATIVFYVWFVNSDYFGAFKAWSLKNLPIYVLALLSLKIIGIVWPPIPGGVLTLASVPVLGWKLAYTVDIVGSIIGSSIAYFIAKRSGLKFMRKIFDDETIARITRLKIKKDREIEAIFLMRLFGGTVVEVICYGAGVLGVRYRNFLLASVLSHLPLGIPIFILADNLLAGKGFMSVILIAIVIVLFYKLRHRYFEYESKF